MNGRDWFVVGARLFGLWLLYSALSFLSVLVDLMLEFANQQAYPNAPGSYLFLFSWQFLLACILIFKTELLANALYQRPDPAAANSPPAA
jgi:uncharacterized BrkB/YihY/UPF0761 family membrane protein